MILPQSQHSKRLGLSLTDLTDEVESALQDEAEQLMTQTTQQTTEAIDSTVQQPQTTEPGPAPQQTVQEPPPPPKLSMPTKVMGLQKQTFYIVAGIAVALVVLLLIRGKKK